MLISKKLSILEVFCLQCLDCHDSLKHPPQAHLQLKSYLPSSVQCSVKYSGYPEVLQCTAEIQQCTTQLQQCTEICCCTITTGFCWVLRRCSVGHSNHSNHDERGPLSEGAIWQTTPRSVARLPCKVAKRMEFLRH